MDADEKQQPTAMQSRKAPGGNRQLGWGLVQGASSYRSSKAAAGQRDPTPGQFFSRRIKSKKCGTCLPVTQKMARGTPELRTNTVSTLAKHQALSEEIRPAFPQSQALFSTANTKHSLASTVRTQIQATSSRRDGFLATTWLHTLPLRGKCHRKAQREEVGGLRAVNP